MGSIFQLRNSQAHQETKKRLILCPKPSRKSSFISISVIDWPYCLFCCNTSVELGSFPFSRPGLPPKKTPRIVAWRNHVIVSFQGAWKHKRFDSKISCKNNPQTSTSAQTLLQNTFGSYFSLQIPLNHSYLGGLWCEQCQENIVWTLRTTQKSQKSTCSWAHELKTY